MHHPSNGPNDRAWGVRLRGLDEHTNGQGKALPVLSVSRVSSDKRLRHGFIGTNDHRDLLNPMTGLVRNAFRRSFRGSRRTVERRVLTEGGAGDARRSSHGLVEELAELARTTLVLGCRMSGSALEPMVLEGSFHE